MEKRLGQWIKYLTFSLFFVAVPSWAQQPSNFGRHYDERMVQFSQQNDINDNTIVMLGNSLTENAMFVGDWSGLLGATNIVNRGISGDTAKGILNRLGSILQHHPKAIIMMCGTNDLSHNLSAQQVFELVCEVIDSIRTEAPETKLVVQSLLPFNEGFKRWKTLDGRSDDVPVINDMLSSYCYGSYVEYVNLYPYFTIEGTTTLRPELTVDGLHLNALGYQLWVNELRPVIQKLNSK